MDIKDLYLKQDRESFVLMLELLGLSENFIKHCTPMNNNYRVTDCLDMEFNELVFKFNKIDLRVITEKIDSEDISKLRKVFKVLTKGDTVTYITLYLEDERDN